MKRTSNFLFPGDRRRRYRVFFPLGVAVLALAASTIWFYKAIHTPRFHSQADQIMTVSQGMSVNQTYRQLQDRSILPDSRALRLWFRFRASRDTLKAGDYRFESPIAPAAVLDKLRRGDIYHQSITFREGLTRFEVANLIQTLNIEGAQDALKLTEEPELIKFISDLDPQATTLEGYLFPDTYQYTRTTTASQLVISMVRRFRQVFMRSSRWLH
jgi:UPF0755 protein